MSQITSPTKIATFLFAGSATLTLRSKVSGQHFTYKVSGIKDKKTGQRSTTRFFVNLLSGPDNENDYTYLGLVERTADAGPRFRTTAKSPNAETPSVKAFGYFFKNVINQNHLPDNLEVRHEGKCGRCGRTLTTPESLDTGVGPECADKLGITWGINTETPATPARNASGGRVKPGMDRETDAPATTKFDAEAWRNNLRNRKLSFGLAG